MDGETLSTTIQRPRRRVLVVDDNLDTVHWIAHLLQGRGHEVQFAINANAALRIARSFRPEIVLLDLALRDMDGLLDRLLEEPR
jgi:CheY-like chemotaxis protein